MSGSDPGHLLLLLAMPRGGARDHDELRRLAAGVSDWEPILEDSERLGATALLGQALEEAAASRPPSVDEACRAALLRGTLRILLAGRVLSEALGALRRSGIEALVLKGVPLAHELYDPPGLRPIGDIDLLVRRADREAALGALAAAGYTLPRESLPLSFYRRHHFHVTLVRDRSEGLPLELHWNAQPRFSLSRIPVEGLWERRRLIACDGVEVPVPGREELFLYLAQHLVRHLIAFGPQTASDPVGAMLEPARRGRLTWLADIVRLATREPGLDWERIRTLAAAWGLEGEIAGLVRYLAGLGVAPDITSSGDRRSGEAALDAIRRGSRLFPTLARASGGLQLRPILVARLWRFTFPGAAWIRWRYGLGPGSGAGRVAGNAALHAAGVAIAAARMAVAVPVAWIRGRFSLTGASPRAVDPDRKPTRASSNCPPGNT